MSKGLQPGWANPDHAFERWCLFMIYANFFFGTCHLIFTLTSLGTAPLPLSAIYLTLSLLFSFNGLINLERYREAKKQRLSTEAALKALTSN